MMNKRVFVMFGILALGLVLAFFAFQTKNASAKNITLKDILFPQSRQNIVAPQTDNVTPTSQSSPTATLFPEGMINPPTQESNWVTTSPEQMEKNAAVVDSVNKLIEKTSKIYATAGWVHTKRNAVSFFSLSKTMPDGSPVPMAWTTDTWLLLDDNGYLVRGVNIQDTGSPTTSQVSIFKDGDWINLTIEIPTDTSNPEAKTPYRPMGYGVLDQALMWKDLVVLEIKDTVIDKESVSVYMMTSRSIKPYEIGKPNYLVMGTVLKYYLSTETGLLMMMEFYNITPDGQYSLVDRETTLVDEKVEEPPAEVLKYLE